MIPFYLAGRPATGPEVLTVRHPYDDQVAGTTSYVTPEQVQEAIASAATAAGPAAALSAANRARALDLTGARVAERTEEFAQLITA